jgi:hypothetical protein
MRLRLTSERQTTIEVDDQSVGPACFTLGVARSGSTLLTDIVTALARANSRHVVDIGDVLFDGGVPQDDYRNSPELLSALLPGNIYVGFRMMPAVLAWSNLFVEGLKVLMVRDPRDVLVSRYYSDGWSHKMPPVDDPGTLSRTMERQRARAQNTTIDEYALGLVPAAARTLMEYLPLLYSPTTVVLPYETYVFDKAALIDRILTHFGWIAEPGLIDWILSWADVFPETEDPGSHIRQVRPGDHRSKLRADTVDRLNQVLAEVMEPFGYRA